MHEIISEILSNIDSIQIDEIKTKLSPYTVDMAVSTPLIPPGENFYRGRKLENGFEKINAKCVKDISYRTDNVPLGRANRAGFPVFYCSNFRDTIFYEVKDLNIGDQLILGCWRNNQRILVNNIGYTRLVFDGLGAERQLPEWLNNRNKDELEGVIVRVDNKEIRELLSELYTYKEPTYYKLTTAIAELHLGEIKNKEIKFGGIMYPSVQMNAAGDNLAIMPWVIDDGCLALRKAFHFRIDSISPNSVQYSILDWATANEDGNLNWKGHAPQWQTRFQGDHFQFILEKGSDEDGNYTISADGIICHWVCRDVNGNIIEQT